MIQQSLDIVRVVGNNAIRPEQRDLKEEVETAKKPVGSVKNFAHILSDDLNLISPLRRLCCDLCKSIHF